MHELIKQLKRHEGLRLKPYKDTVGITTIGYGRNLEDVGITEQEANILLVNDIVKCVEEAERFTWFKGLNSARKDVVVNMLFNLGLNRFKGFKNTINLISQDKFKEASIEMLNSTWAKQVGNRAIELSIQMKTGLY